jgi:hypothetical protein
MQTSLRSGLFVLATAALFMFQASTRAQANDPWEKLTFLIGTWSGGGSGKPDDAIGGEATFSFDLDKKIMTRRNRAEIAPKPGEKSPVVHEDLMIIYPVPANGGFHATYFDNEGHIIQYKVSFPEEQPSVVFESDASEKGPRFRLVNTLGAGGVMSTDFFIAPPGGEFRSYVKGTMKKKAVTPKK